MVSVLSICYVLPVDNSIIGYQYDSYQIDRNQIDGKDMSSKQPKGVVEFPLTASTARKIVQDLATNHTNRIRWSQHAKQRMVEREVSIRQVFTLLKSKYSVFREGPYCCAQGDWLFNLKGMAAGQIIEVSVALKNHHESPLTMIITVWVH